VNIRFMRYLIKLAVVTLLLLVARPLSAADEPKPQLRETDTGLIPRTITLQGKDISLRKALEEIARQTGNPVEDRRRVKEDQSLRLDLNKATFWQAVDAIARAADARVSLYEKDALVALTDGPHVKVPTSYSGIFRVTVMRIVLARSLETDHHVCTAYLEVAWEPRFQPLMLEIHKEALVVQDDKGRTIDVPDSGQGMLPIGQRLAKDVQIQFAAPRRSAASLGLLKGAITVVGPGKILTFRFDKLARIEKREDARTQTQEGVTVSLRELRPEAEEGDAIWTVGLLLEYPSDGPKLESFQSWIVNNQIYLEKGKGGAKQKLEPNLGYETDESTDTKAIVRYRFGDEPSKKLLLGKFSDWNLVYHTPGKITSIEVPFEFKDLPLP
jgi:hypothetical protein